MSVSKSGNQNHDNTSTRRQTACAGATQAAFISAEITFYRAAKASALANGCGVEPFITALRQLGTGGA
jgi:hypothetical protein